MGERTGTPEHRESILLEAGFVDQGVWDEMTAYFVTARKP
jgi:hypothetical protein